jgi:hypothetical protein
MTTSASLALQQQIFRKLTNHPELIALLGGANVYDHVPQDTAYPYINIGQIAVRDAGTFTDNMQEHTIAINAFTNNEGKREVYNILHTVREILHDANMKLDGHHLISLQYRSSQAEKDERGEGYNGSATYRAVTEPII